MSPTPLDDCRTITNAMREAIKHSGLDPERALKLLDLLDANLTSIEGELQGPRIEPVQPVRALFRGHLAVIEGGRANEPRGMH